MNVPDANMYYVIYKGERSGPHSANEIVNLLRNREISMLHRVIDGTDTLHMADFILRIEGDKHPLTPNPKAHSDHQPAYQPIKAGQGSHAHNPLGVATPLSDVVHATGNAQSGTIESTATSHTTPPPHPGTDQSDTDPAYATIAFILMCMGFLLGALTAIPAVFFGHLALDQLKANNRKKGLGLTVAALVIGYAQTAASVIILILFLIMR